MVPEDVMQSFKHRQSLSIQEHPIQSDGWDQQQAVLKARHMVQLLCMEQP